MPVAWLPLQTLRVIWALRQHERWTRAQLAAHQAAGLRRLRAHAYARSPFYQRFHRGLFDRPLAQLPVLTKAMLMEHFDELATDRAIRLADVRALAAQRQPDRRYLDRYRLLATSGSSGQPGFFLYDPAEWLTLLTAYARGLEWSGASLLRLGGRRLATIASTSAWHLSAQVAGAAPAWWMPALRLPATEPLDRLVPRLNAWQPDVLIAYASVLRRLAEEQLAGRLRLRPSYILAGAEGLSAETRQRSQLAWGVAPFNQYGATETGNLAAERAACRQMHLFEDLVLTEVVDADNRPAPPGAFGAKLLVTTLFSRTQPLIRYELNDSLCLAAAPCACGHPFAVVAAIHGRVEDLLDLPALAGGRVSIDPLVFNQILDIQPVAGWQVAQPADDRLLVRVCGPRPSFDPDALAGQIGQALAEHGARVPVVQVRIVPSIPPAASGKTPLVQSRAPASL